MTTKTARTEPDLLGIYLNDHLAVATAGLGLAQRMAGSAGPGSDSAGLLRKLAGELKADRAALEAMMRALGLPVRSWKVFGAWAGQKAGVLKLNGHWLSRSPLSSLEETEGLRLVVEFNTACWRTLRGLASIGSGLDAAQLDELLTRAAAQAAALDSHRLSVADHVFSERSK